MQIKVKISIPLMFRIRLWIAVKCMQMANQVLGARPKLAERAGVTVLTPDQMRNLEAEMRDHTIQ